MSKTLFSKTFSVFSNFSEMYFFPENTLSVFRILINFVHFYHFAKWQNMLKIGKKPKVKLYINMSNSFHVYYFGNRIKSITIRILCKYIEKFLVPDL